MRLKRTSEKYAIMLVAPFLLYSGWIFAQADISFIKYLSKQNLYREHLSYLSFLDKKGITKDSLNFLKAKYYLQHYNDSLFFINYDLNKSLFMKDTCAFTAAGIQLLNAPIKSQNRWFTSYDTSLLTISGKSIHAIWILSLAPNSADGTLVPKSIREDFLKYKKYSSRKPFIASVFSTFIPGLGKLYAGKKRSFIVTLLTHIGNGAQMYEAITRIGVKNPFTLFSISFFGIFYAANIYGSYHDMKEVKYQTRKQFLINASNYYNINCSCDLY